MRATAESNPTSGTNPPDRNKRTKIGAVAAIIVVLCLLPVFTDSTYTLHIFILTFI